MAINWTPWDVPMHRRLEVFYASVGVFVALVLGPLSLIIIAYILWAGNIYLKAVCVLYLSFIYYDRNTGDTGGRGIGVKIFRNFLGWKHYINYFPVDLVKTADLPADRNYIVCLFPHGVICQSAFTNFGNNLSKFPQLFPGIRSKFTTLGVHMYWPISREIILNFGMCSASANSLTWLCTQSNDPNHPTNRDGYTSNAAILMVGGAEEAFSALPNRYRFVVKNRKGFIKIALKTGTPIVPAITFGENNIYEVEFYPPGTIKRSIQDFIKKYTGFAPVNIKGRGYFQYDFGMIPRRHPMTTVMGAAIPIQKNLTPSSDEIDQVHSIFCQRLTELFETHKNNYIENANDIQLEII